MLIADFRINGISISVNKNIQKKLRTVRDELTNGQWEEALDELDEITPQGNLTPEIYDKIHLSITTYIADKF